MRWGGAQLGVVCVVPCVCHVGAVWAPFEQFYGLVFDQNEGTSGPQNSGTVGSILEPHTRGSASLCVGDAYGVHRGRWQALYKP